MSPEQRAQANSALSQFMESIASDSIVRDVSGGSIWIAVSASGETSHAVQIDDALRGLPGVSNIEDVILKHVEFGVWL